MNVLLTNANSRMALCLARSLELNGHNVIAADYIPNSMTFFSKHISDHFLYPSPFSAPQQFLSFLQDQVTKLNVDVIIPIHEETFLLSQYHERFAQLARMPLPDYQSIVKVHNKALLYDLLQELKIPTPTTMPLTKINRYSDINRIFPGSVLLKPRQGGGNWAIHLLDPSRDYEPQIEHYLSTNRIEESRVLLQEWIPPFKKQSHVVLYQQGNLVQDFADVHLRDFPLTGGAGCLRVSSDPSPMTEFSRKLFDSLCWHGVAEVEYIVDAQTGKYHLIEVNPRIWGGVNSAICSGLDISAILMNIALGEDVRPSAYRYGVHTRWFWGDMRVFPDLFYSSSSKRHTVVEYLKLLFDDTKTDEFYWDDPLPFFVWPIHAVFKALKSRSFSPIAYDSLAGEWK